MNKDTIKPKGEYRVVCRDRKGKVKWEVKGSNLVVNEGKQYLLDAGFSGAAQVDPWSIGITAASPTPAAGDTMASHAGWTEFTDYTEAVRQTFVEIRSGQSITNSASKASFAIDADSSVIGGLFITSSTTKGGATGTLMSVVAFTEGNRSADDGDTLEVTYTYSVA